MTNSAEFNLISVPRLCLIVMLKMSWLFPAPFWTWSTELGDGESLSPAKGTLAVPQALPWALGGVALPWALGAWPWLEREGGRGPAVGVRGRGPGVSIREGVALHPPPWSTPDTAQG